MIALISGAGHSHSLGRAEHHDGVGQVGVGPARLTQPRPRVGSLLLKLLDVTLPQQNRRAQVTQPRFGQPTRPTGLGLIELLGDLSQPSLAAAQSHGLQDAPFPTRGANPWVVMTRFPHRGCFGGQFLCQCLEGGVIKNGRVLGRLAGGDQRLHPHRPFFKLLHLCSRADRSLSPPRWPLPLALLFAIGTE